MPPTPGKQEPSGLALPAVPSCLPRKGSEWALSLPSRQRAGAPPSSPTSTEARPQPATQQPSALSLPPGGPTGGSTGPPASLAPLPSAALPPPGVAALQSPAKIYPPAPYPYHCPLRPAETTRGRASSPPRLTAAQQAEQAERDARLSLLCQEADARRVEYLRLSAPARCGAAQGPT